MTTEDDFQKALDADPCDWQTRLVFADWLQDRNDPRAEGYRQLGRLQICSVTKKDGFQWPGYCFILFKDLQKSTDAWDYMTEAGAFRKRMLLAEFRSEVWFLQTQFRAVESAKTNVLGDDGAAFMWACAETRREIEDCAALAYNDLSYLVQSEINAIQPLGREIPAPPVSHYDESKED